MKKLIIILAAIPILLTSCSKDPYADFSASTKVAEVGESVYFTNLSLDANSYEWDFGDNYYSNNFNVSHYWETPGLYTVTLTAFGDDGRTDFAVMDITVIGGELEITVRNELTGNLVNNARVRLFPTLDDWDNITNPLPEIGYTGTNGTVLFTDLAPGFYYVEIDDNNYTNVYLGLESVDNIEVEVTADPGSSYELYVTPVSNAPASLEVQVLEYLDEYVVEGASIILYETIEDWENETNPVAEEFTNFNGIALFDNLAPNIRYYVDVWEANHDNYQLAAEDVGWIETQFMRPGVVNTFVAYVDYYETTKKSTVSRKELKVIRKSETTKKELRINPDSKRRKGNTREIQR